MKHLTWEIKLGILLVVLSAIVYFIHYLIFRDPHHIFIYMIGDIAFVFIEVLMVTLIIHRLLGEREKSKRLEKLNMVIEVFFSELGTELLTYFSDFDPKLNKIKSNLIVTSEWSDKEFLSVTKKLKDFDYKIDVKKIDLGYLRDILIKKREFLIRLLENPVLLEHDPSQNL